MKATITQYKKTVFSTVILTTMMFSTMVKADAAKCSPCQAAKSIRDAAAQSIKDAQAAALAAGQAFSRAAELDTDPAKCKPCQQGRTTRDEMAANIDQDPAKCKPCGRTTRDEMATELDADPAKCKPCGRTTRDEMAASIQPDPSSEMVEACCEFCAQPDSLGCQGENRARCNVCQQGLIKMSIAEAMATALAAAMAAKEEELDQVPADVSRAPREAIVYPCDPCKIVQPCNLSQQLCILQQCCNAVNQRLECQGHEARKCCKRLQHKMDDLEDLVGNPAASVIDIPSCSEGFTITDFIDNTEVDMMTWLKSLYVLLYQVYLCSCTPCIEDNSVIDNIG